MTYQEIAQMIESIGLPYAFYQFPDDTEQAPPFICFLYDYDYTYYLKITVFDDMGITAFDLCTYD